MMIAQISPDQWRELINFSVPLFLLIVVSIGIWKASRYVGKNVLEPLVAKSQDYLETQNEEARKQTSALTDLSTNFKESGEHSRASLDLLIKMHSDPNSIFATKKVQQRLDSLLKIQGLLAAAVDKAIQDPGGSEVERLLRQIDLICSKHLDL